MAPSPIRRKASTKCKVCGKKYPKAALKMQKRTIRAEPRAKALARKRRLRSKKMRSNFSPEALNKKVTTPRRRAVKKVTKAVKNRKHCLILPISVPSTGITLSLMLRTGQDSSDSSIPILPSSSLTLAIEHTSQDDDDDDDDEDDETPLRGAALA
ncbi:hypothetical protein AWZ03_011230 [Drosophila navojoa]|uniref:Uncharacterized protein n=1 Tax=Drosophila navojoa TaxID=7232 RepID=A0A484B237_DRONA|nr:hypothetical protein AWZ03_011230 [Drosophila navojoa]